MSLLHAVGGGADDKLMVEDVFSTYLYTGNGSTQAINNGIDLAGKGGLVWTKTRSLTQDNILFDTTRNGHLATNKTDAQVSGYVPTYFNFNSNGFFVDNAIGINGAGNLHASWTFRKAPKFFDVQTKVHTTGTPSTVDLSTLGVVGMVSVKATSTISNWFAWHKDLTAGNNLKLNLTDAQSTTNAYLSVSGTTLTISGSAPSGTYVIYAWAHDPSADGIIQCGSYVGNGSATNDISLGFEPQYLMTKATTGATDWLIIDSIRSICANTVAPQLKANIADAETLVSSPTLTPVGFKITTTSSVVNESGTTYIYLAIRRPMKVPTSGTEVFQPIVYTGTNTDNRLVNTTIAPDMVMVREINDTTPLGMAVASRLTGNYRLQTANTAAELLDADSFMTPTAVYGNSFSAMNGFGVGNDATCKVNADTTANNHIAFAFKRAKGFMDNFCYTGTGVARTVNHNLGVVPELIIVKSRSAAYSWRVYYGDTAKAISLNSTETPLTSIDWWNNTAPTASVFTIGVQSDLNNTASTFIAYLFATLAGVSKVGSYTGNGSTQTINCGFTTGARFILIKRTDSTGDWYIWDTARGIVAANDPHLSLNTTDAEVTTDDSIDLAVEGFICNQNTATNINVNGGSYIFLAIA